MNHLSNPSRVDRLVRLAIEKFELNLEGLTVLTETGSGSFVLTPIIAACAGAEQVISVTADSRFGGAAEIVSYTRSWAGFFGVEDVVVPLVDSASARAAEADIVTNLGFVRPIDRHFVGRMREGAVVTLMCEPWEVRPSDVDLQACVAGQIPVAGTNEGDERLLTFRFVGELAVKLLHEVAVEVSGAVVAVVGSPPFGTEIERALRSNGARTHVLDRTWGADSIRSLLWSADALIVAEHRSKDQVIGSDWIHPGWLADTGCAVVHISGVVDRASLSAEGIIIHPPVDAAPGYMTVTTDYIGPRPVIDLHTAGLKVGQGLFEGYRETKDFQLAIQSACRGGLGMAAV